MALIARNQVKVITASGGGTLTAPAGRSYLVKDLFCAPSSNDSYLTLLVNGTTVAKLRVKGLSGNHLPFPFIKTAQIYEQHRHTLLQHLRDAGRAQLGLPPRVNNGSLDEWLKNPLDIRFPLISGQVFTVSRYAEAGNVVLLYDIYDAGDITAKMPNGTESPEQRYVSYATAGASSANGALAVSTSLLWTGAPAWPFDGTAVPQNCTYGLLAIVGCPNAKGASAANKGYSTYLQLINRNNILFDEDKNGLPFLGDVSGISAAGYVSGGSVIGPQTAENPRPPFILDPPLVFGAGDSLTVNEIIAGWASGGPGASEADIAFVLQRLFPAA